MYYFLPCGIMPKGVALCAYDNLDKRSSTLKETQDFVLLVDEKALTSAENSEKKIPQKPKKEKERKKKRMWKRIALSVGTFLLCVIVAVFSVCGVLLNGPSTTMRDALVLSAKQASATKWVPGLFLPQETVHAIEAGSKTVTYDVISMEEVDSEQENKEDEWADAIDGIRFINITKPTFKAYLLMIRDPSRLYVGTASDFKSGKVGSRIFDIAEELNAVAAINGGEFPDGGGIGSGATPIGITYSKGKMVWPSPTNRSFVGITKDNKLVVSEGMTQNRAEELGIRDGVCFQTGNCLITNDGTNMTLHYSDGDTGRAQRTAVGQRADGTILLLVTDGRTASSIGATHNELIQIMREYGAVCAGKLDGGSSAMMYYRNYYELYDYDMSTLDEYQRQGLVNNYKAFTEPRRLPTYFIVGGAEK